jgi:uncharacterized OB-fold protein
VNTTGIAIVTEEDCTPAWPGLTGQDETGPFLRGGRCAACGHVALSVQPICPGCWAEGAMAEMPIGRTGRVYSMTVIHAAPPGFDAPYAVGYVDIEHGLRIFAHLETGEAAPAIGDAVELTVAPIRRDAAGAWQSGPRYRRRAGGGRA